MKFTRSFKGATGGNPYPQEFEVGEDCPADLVKAATEAGALAKEAKPKSRASKS